MVDVVDRKTRSRMMSGIRGKDTKPELMVRKALFARGFRYRLHDKRLPGKPDLVFPRYKAIIFIHGCFWHLHDCHLFKWPSSNTPFWKSKITRNRQLDQENYAILKKSWRMLLVWECALKGREKRPLEDVINKATIWLQSKEAAGVISGNVNTKR